MILFVDTETDGLTHSNLPHDHPSQPHLVQIGLLLVDESGAEWATVEMIVKPEGWTIPDAAARVHGITTDIAKRAGVPLALATATYTNLRAVSAAVVAYNLDFDDLVMRAAIARTGRKPSHPGPDRRTCCMRLATDVVKLPPTLRMLEAGMSDRFKPPSLKEAYNHFFSEDPPGAHGALADARSCARVFFELRRRSTASSIGKGGR